MRKPAPFLNPAPLVFLAGLTMAGAALAPAARAQDVQSLPLTLQCLAKSGEGVELESGALMTYFSAGSTWTLALDLDSSLASVDLRTNKRGTLITFTEKYRVTINSEFYNLLSTEIKTGPLSNGVYNIHDIEVTINRRSGQYRRMLRVQDLNSNTGTYKYYSETGECVLKPPPPDPTAPPPPGAGTAAPPGAPVPPTGAPAPTNAPAKPPATPPAPAPVKF